jgi:hypothetical protein
MILSGFILATFAADILTLNNEMAFEGKIKKIKGCALVFIADGEKYIIPASDVFSIQFEDVNDKVYRDYLKIANDDKCFSGRIDAENYHGKEVGHVALGFLFGPFCNNWHCSFKSYT